MLLEVWLKPYYHGTHIPKNLPPRETEGLGHHSGLHSLSEHLLADHDIQTTVLDGTSVSGKHSHRWTLRGSKQADEENDFKFNRHVFTQCTGGCRVFRAPCQCNLPLRPSAIGGPVQEDPHSLRSQPAWPESWLCHPHAMWPGASHLTSFPQCTRVQRRDNHRTIF